MSYEDIKWKFMKDEIWIPIFGAITRGAKLYSGNPSKEEKEKFQETLQKYVDEHVEDYRNGIDEELHMKNIKELCNATKEHAEILKNGNLSIGRGQKILNLYLKYLWCLNEIPSPPHCPLDRTILKEHLNLDISWTKLDKLRKDEDEGEISYEELIEKARRKTEKGQSLAEWELEKFSRD